MSPVVLPRVPPFSQERFCAPCLRALTLGQAVAARTRLLHFDVQEDGSGRDRPNKFPGLFSPRRVSPSFFFFSERREISFPFFSLSLYFFEILLILSIMRGLIPFFFCSFVAPLKGNFSSFRLSSLPSSLPRIRFFVEAFLLPQRRGQTPFLLGPPAGFQLIVEPFFLRPESFIPSPARRPPSFFLWNPPPPPQSR